VDGKEGRKQRCHGVESVPRFKIDRTRKA
jgi:hypothetical protein